MEKLVVPGQAKIPSTAEVVVWIVFLTGGSFFALLAVQSQVSRSRMLPKGSPGAP